MLLRICLVLAILAGLGIIGVSQFQLRPQIELIRDTRDENKSKWDAAETKARDFKKNWDQTKASLDKSEKELGETRETLTATTGRLEAEQKRTAELQSTNQALSANLRETGNKLAAYEATGFTADQIAGLADRIKGLQDSLEVSREETQIIQRQYGIVTNRLAQLISPEAEQGLPEGVKGRVVVVDPKWNFVVLNIGQKHGVPENGVALVSRSGKLIAKVKIVSIQADRCIANILPGWRLDEVFEGDLVF
jgi:multidrug efflux pump subunit AcrA (membrane-fusion protein)